MRSWITLSQFPSHFVHGSTSAWDAGVFLALAFETLLKWWNHFCCELVCKRSSGGCSIAFGQLWVWLNEGPKEADSRLEHEPSVCLTWAASHSVNIQTTFLSGRLICIYTSRKEKWLMKQRNIMKEEKQAAHELKHLSSCYVIMSQWRCVRYWEPWQLRLKPEADTKVRSKTKNKCEALYMAHDININFEQDTFAEYLP